MSTQTKLKTTYDVQNVIQPLYTGGPVALDSTGRILVTCIGEEAVLSDLVTGQILARIEGDGEILTTVALTPSASHLITCSRSLSMKFFDLSREDDPASAIQITLIRTTKPHATPVVCTAVDVTGTLVATGAADGAIKVWDIRGGFTTHIFRSHHAVVSALHFFQIRQTDWTARSKRQSKPETNALVTAQDVTSRLRLASGYNDGKVRTWDLLQRKSTATLSSHVSVVRSFDYSLDSNTLVSASRDRTVVLWDAKSWAVKRVIPVFEELEACGFLGTEELFYTGGERGQIRFWHSTSGEEASTDQPASEGTDSILHILQIKSQPYLLSVHTSQNFLLHSYEFLKELKKDDKVEPLPVLCRIAGTHDEIIDLAYVGPDKSVMALATNTEDIRLVSLNSSDSHTSSLGSPNYFGASVANLQGHSDIIICISADESGHWLATGAKDNTAKLWKLDTEHNSYECFSTFTGHAESIGAVSIPSTGTESTNALDKPPAFLLTGSQDRTIKRWNVPRTSSPVSKSYYTRKAHDKDINAIACSLTSSIFASASQDRTVKIWSVDDGETQGILRGHKRGVWSVTFAPRNTPAVAGDTDHAVRGSRGLVLTGSGDRTLKIWSLNDFSCIRTFEGHPNSVLKVLWLPVPPRSSTDSERKRDPYSTTSTIASAGSDGLVKVWSTNDGECLATLDNHTERVWALAFDSTTRTLVSGGADGVVTFWRDTTRETAVEAEKLEVARVEQDQELRNHEREGHWREAIVLALQLNHPQRLLSLFQRVVDTNPPEDGSISGVRNVDEVLGSLDDEQLLALLMRLRDWNTNARLAPLAQRILNVIVRKYSSQRLAGLGKRKGGREVLDALRAYTERHFRRVDELWSESWVMEFLLGQMDQLGVNDRAGEQDVITI